MASYEEFDKIQFTVDIPGDAVLTANEWLALISPYRGRVVQVDWTPRAAVTAAAASFNVTLRNRGAGAGAVNIALRAYTATNGVAWTRETQPLVVLNAVAANLTIAKNDVLTVEKTINGAGLAMPAGIVSIWIAPN
jgi:hypothetical protein